MLIGIIGGGVNNGDVIIILTIKIAKEIVASPFSEPKLKTL